MNSNSITRVTAWPVLVVTPATLALSNIADLRIYACSSVMRPADLGAFRGVGYEEGRALEGSRGCVSRHDLRVGRSAPSSPSEQNYADARCSGRHVAKSRCRVRASVPRRFY